MFLPFRLDLFGLRKTFPAIETGMFAIVHTMAWHSHANQPKGWTQIQAILSLLAVNNQEPRLNSLLLLQRNRKQM